MIRNLNASKKATTIALSLLLVVGVLSLSSAPVMRTDAVSSATLVISINGGVLQFPGESATFYFTTTANGNVVNPSNITVTLYYPNNINNIALNATQVTNGVYEVQWPIPQNAPAGYYALVVYASYGYGTFAGLAVQGFEISQGLQNNQNQVMTGIGGLSAQLSSVEANIMTVLNSSVAAPVLSASALLGGFLLPSASAGAAQGIGLTILALMSIGVLVSSGLLLKRKSII